MNKEEIEKILKDNGLSEAELIFKSNVKKLRVAAPGSPSMVDTAQAIGINYGTYRLIESLTPVNVKFETMDKIAHYYNVSVDVLFKI